SLRAKILLKLAPPLKRCQRSANAPNCLLGAGEIRRVLHWCVDPGTNGNALTLESSKKSPRIVVWGQTRLISEDAREGKEGPGTSPRPPVPPSVKTGGSAHAPSPNEKPPTAQLHRPARPGRLHPWGSLAVGPVCWGSLFGAAFGLPPFLTEDTH